MPFGDTLNVRKYPCEQFAEAGAYPNGTVLQMTGKCTGGVNLLDISGQPEWKQEQLVRYRWCQIWHDPAQNGNFVDRLGLRQVHHALLKLALRVLGHNLWPKPAKSPLFLVAPPMTRYAS